jgi:hypothetical protein
MRDASEKIKKLPKQTIGSTTSNGWTAERRRKQAKAIRRWKPWRKSTGPRTHAGKRGVAQNAYRGGMREFERTLRAAIRGNFDASRALAEGWSYAPGRTKSVARESVIPRIPKIRWSRLLLRPRVKGLSLAQNVAIKDRVASALKQRRPPLDAALQAMRVAWNAGGPLAAVRFAAMCLRYTHRKPPRVRCPNRSRNS